MQITIRRQNQTRMFFVGHLAVAAFATSLLPCLSTAGCADETHAAILLDKPAYQPGEEITFEVNRDVYSWTNTSFQVEMLVEGTWTVVPIVECGAGGALNEWRCVDSAVQWTTARCEGVIGCDFRQGGVSQTWNQQILMLKDEPCGSESFKQWVPESALPGRYRVTYSCFPNAQCNERETLQIATEFEISS
jgi:hypothetical protein